MNDLAEGGDRTEHASARARSTRPQTTVHADVKRDEHDNPAAKHHQHRHSHDATPATLTPERKALLHRRIRLIVAITIGYNLIEAAVSIAAGSAASSAALIGFGLDSSVEVLSAAAVAWQFSRADPERWEKPTLRVISIAFFILAAYVIITASLSLIGAIAVEHSTAGIVITALSVVIMPFLSLAERRTGIELGSATAIADSKQTLICTYLSAAVLVGLLLNLLAGWEWADSIAALVIAVFAIREGIEAWKGDTCATPIGMILDDTADTACRRDVGRGR